VKQYRLAGESEREREDEWKRERCKQARRYGGKASAELRNEPTR
jgi:hypothetical protein